MADPQVIADYRCEQCGNEFPLMVPGMGGAPQCVVGGIHVGRLCEHGPGCRSQVFDLIGNVQPLPAGGPHGD